MATSDLIPSQKETAEQTTAVHLTEREMDVLRLVAQGHASKEAANILCLARSTVDFHLGNVFAKLRVKNRMLAVRTAWNLGLLAPPEQLFASNASEMEQRHDQID